MQRKNPYRDHGMKRIKIKGPQGRITIVQKSCLMIKIQKETEASIIDEFVDEGANAVVTLNGSYE